MAKVYVVKAGRVPGIYKTWNECKAQTERFPGAIFKSFKDNETDEIAAYLGTTNKKSNSKSENEGDIQKQGLSKEEVLRLTHELSKNPDNCVVYVDGSFKDKRYSFGLLQVDNEKIVYEDKGVGTNQEAAELNNVAGEMLGAMKALLHALSVKRKKVIIFHDYQGISSWVTNEWKAKNEFTKAYQKFMETKKGNIDVEFVKVKGHEGNKYNERVDTLAKEALGIA